jgi:hypothetical protein
MNVNEHGGYKIGTKVGQIKRYMSRNQVQFVANATLDMSEVPVSDMSVREIVSKISNFQPSTFTPTRLTISFPTLTMHKTLPSTQRYLTHYLSHTRYFSSHFSQ